MAEYHFANRSYCGVLYPKESLHSLSYNIGLNILGIKHADIELEPGNAI